MSVEWRDRIHPNLENVTQRITLAAERSGRSIEAIQIVAISKGQPLEAIKAAIDLGLDHIGENRVEEALHKQAQITQRDPTWHMVGHIQSRKAREIPNHFSWVHSIDRLTIAERLSRQATEQAGNLSVLLECNVSGETSKGGWNLADRSKWPTVIPEFQKILALPAINVLGLMTMAPWVQDEKILRTTFQTLRELQDFLSKQLELELPHLSMGMSDDFEYAIEEGATMLRLGRAIFGPRQPKI